MLPSSPARLSRRAAFRRLLGVVGMAPLALSSLGVVPSLLGEDAAFEKTVRIEEDWSLQIGVPDPETDSPQISTVLAPSWSLCGKYAVLELNCATQPAFSSGGVQLQLWCDGSIVQSRSNSRWGSLHLENEVIRYTSVMSIKDSHLTFEIINGSSETWDHFGVGELKVQTETWRTDLNSYDPNFTLSNSQIGFASHRVRRLALERVRYFKADDTVILDYVPRVLHRYDPSA